MSIILPAPAWKELIARLTQDSGTILLLGAVDTGKSRLAKYFAGEFLGKELSVGLVDADPGQSSLCLPGTVGMKIFKVENDLNYFTCEHISFIGTTNPSKSLFQLIAATRMLADRARHRADIVIIDTTGLISGALGTRLKIAKIRAVKPTHIVAVQYGDECEAILSRISDGKIQLVRLSPSPLVKKRSQEVRARYRREKLTAWFLSQRLKEYILSAERTAIFRFGRQVSPSDNDLGIGTIIGLNHGISTITIGVVTEVGPQRLTFQAPISSLTGINRIVYGDLSFSGHLQHSAPYMMDQ